MVGGLGGIANVCRFGAYLDVNQNWQHPLTKNDVNLFLFLRFHRMEGHPVRVGSRCRERPN